MRPPWRPIRWTLSSHVKLRSNACRDGHIALFPITKLPTQGNLQRYGQDKPLICLLHRPEKKLFPFLWIWIIFQTFPRQKTRDGVIIMGPAISQKLVVKSGLRLPCHPTASMNNVCYLIKLLSLFPALVIYSPFVAFPFFCRLFKLLS